MLISFEGVDFAGKSTLVKEVSRLLNDLGFASVICSNYYDQPNSKKWFELFLDESLAPNAFEEIMLSAYAHSRAIRSNLIPRLEEGNIVLMDRYLGSFLAMQGYIQGKDTLVKEVLSKINYPKPDLYFCLRLDEDEFERRKALRALDKPSDRIEKLTWSKYHSKLQEYFIVASKDLGLDAITLDASSDLSFNAREVIRHIRNKLDDILDEVDFRY